MPLVVPHRWLSELAPRLYCQTFPASLVDAELDEFLAALEAHVAAQRKPFAWVVMADALLSSTAKQRKTFAAAEDRMKEQDQRLCAGTAFVLTSSLARGAVTAVYWISPPVYPYAIRSTREDAIAWATQKLDAALAKDGD